MPSPADPWSPANANAPKRRWHILYAEDVRELREVATMALSRDGHSIQCEEDGQLALNRITKDPSAFDLILTDHHMPNMNGLELVQHLREMKYPGKIIVFSSELKPQIAHAYHELGVDLVLPKPIFPQELRRVLAEL